MHGFIVKLENTQNCVWLPRAVVRASSDKKNFCYFFSLICNFRKSVIVAVSLRKQPMKIICSGGSLQDICKVHDIYWLFTMVFGKNASENRFRTVITNVVCTSDTTL
jgi:hypothetical protein